MGIIIPSLTSITEEASGSTRTVLESANRSQSAQAR